MPTSWQRICSVRVCMFAYYLEEEEPLKTEAKKRQLIAEAEKKDGTGRVQKWSKMPIFLKPNFLIR
jgi:hypothetical protein